MSDNDERKVFFQKHDASPRIDGEKREYSIFGCRIRTEDEIDKNKTYKNLLGFDKKTKSLNITPTKNSSDDKNGLIGQLFLN